jgi:hypothetical protein
MKSTLIIAGLFVTGLMSSSAGAAPLGGIAAPATPDSVVEQVQHVYGYTCGYGPRGWYYRNRRGDIIACRPARPLGFGYAWREFGGRSGWYHERHRRWH